MIMRSRPEMEIREILPPEMEAARRLLQAAGWAGRVSDPARFRELVSRSQGASCALTDGTENGYIAMLVVAERHRRKGSARGRRRVLRAHRLRTLAGGNGASACEKIG